jgi:DNA-directed RNA polymerase specialized sigma24 family protein
MDERDWLAERFEEHRTRLRAVAYRMLGSLSEADDAVQEAWLRLSSNPRQLTTADGRYTAMTTLPLAWCPSMWATAFAASLSG